VRFSFQLILSWGETENILYIFHSQTGRIPVAGIKLLRILLEVGGDYLY
jgi:hypothetical protein